MNGKITALIAGALAILATGLLISGVSPMEATKTLFQGSLGSLGAFSGTLKETAPLLILGLGVYIALKAGLFNIGVEGQFLVGATLAATVGLRVQGPVGILLSILVACLGGMLWALPAGLIKAYRNGHEVITTIMMNYVAGRFTDFLVQGPLKAAGSQEASTADLATDTRIPALINSGAFELGWSICVGVIGVIMLWFWMRKTVAGYELQAVGANPTASKFAGISAKKIQVWAMSLSGGIAGIAGAFQVLAYEGRFYQGFSPGYGFDALGVALLAGNSAIGLIPASLLFGILAKGGVSLQANGVPKGITSVVLGAMILVAASIRFRSVKSGD